MAASLRATQPALHGLAVRELDRPRSQVHGLLDPAVLRCFAFECSSLSWSLVINEGIHWSICTCRQHWVSNWYVEDMGLTVVKVVIVLVEISQLLEVDLVAEDTAYTTEALHELVALGGPVRHELERRTELPVVFSNPLQEGLLRDDLHLLAGLLVHEFLAVVLLLLLGRVQQNLVPLAVLESPASDLQVLEHDEGLDSAQLESLKGVVDTEAHTSSILADVIEVLPDELLFLDKLDVAEGLGRELDGLVEAVLATVRHVYHLDDLGGEAVVEHVGRVEVVLEVGRASENESRDVHLIVGDEVLNRQLRHLAHVVVALLFSETGETQRGLTTTTVLLGEIDGELVDNIPRVAAKRAEESAITVHDDEAELLIGLEQLGERLSVEFVVTEVQRGVDGLERLEVDVDLSLLPLGGQDFTTVDDEPVRRYFVVELEALLGRCDGRQDRLSVNARFDVGRGTLWWRRRLDRQHQGEKVRETW